MITEKSFVLYHSAFWRQLLPMVEDYVRYQNLSAGRFADEFSSKTPASSRGVINEASFRVFAASRERGQDPAQLPSENILSCVDAAVVQIRTMRQYGRTPVPTLDEDELREVVMLARRTCGFFERARQNELTVLPTFAGCGWLSECHGDVLGSSTLFEIKAGARGFRSSDIRQVLAYCGLNFASKQYSIQDVCLFNPRTGRHIHESLQGLCMAVAGRHAIDVLGDIVEYISEPVLL